MRITRAESGNQVYQGRADRNLALNRRRRKRGGGEEGRRGEEGGRGLTRRRREGKNCVTL